MTQGEARILAKAIVDEWQKRVAPLQEELLTVDELAALLKVSPSWVRLHAAEYDNVKIGGLLRFPKSKVMRQILA